VEHRTFSGAYAVSQRQPVMYVTERCVFELGEEGMELTEVAPGVDLERDVLAHMAFRPIMRQPPRLMDARIFQDSPMGIRDELLSLPLEDRMTYHAKDNLFFINFEGYTVKTLADVEQIRTQVEVSLAQLQQKVYAIVNYDNFTIVPEVMDAYSSMVKYLVERYYAGVSRYTTSTFLRLKLGDALAERDVAPHIYESRDEAHNHLSGLDQPARS
jgi:propionate CoA-transferase